MDDKTSDSSLSAHPYKIRSDTKSRATTASSSTPLGHRGTPGFGECSNSTERAWSQPAVGSTSWCESCESWKWWLKQNWRWLMAMPRFNGLDMSPRTRLELKRRSNGSCRVPPRVNGPPKRVGLVTPAQACSGHLKNPKWHKGNIRQLSNY